MCKLYANTMPLDAMRGLFDVSRERADLGNMEPLRAVYPKYEAPILIEDDGERRLMRAQWGFLTPNKSKKTGAWLKPTAWNNTRDDKIRTAPLWRGSFEERRCLVPASSYAEATGRNPATYHWFRVTDAQGFAFAGIWRRQTGVVGETEIDATVYSIVTTTPNELAATVHNRMPVVLAPDEFDRWIKGGAEKSANLLRSPPDGALEIFASGQGMREEPA